MESATVYIVYKEKPAILRAMVTWVQLVVVVAGLFIVYFVNTSYDHTLQAPSGDSTSEREMEEKRCFPRCKCPVPYFILSADRRKQRKAIFYFCLTAL